MYETLVNFPLVCQGYVRVHIAAQDNSKITYYFLVQHDMPISNMIIVFGGIGQVPSIIIWQLICGPATQHFSHLQHILMLGTLLIAAGPNNKGTTQQALKCSGGDE